MSIPSRPAEATVASEACPFCHSRDVTTTSKEVNDSTYWRCTACGQIWNAARLQHPQPRPYGRFAEMSPPRAASRRRW